jgi:hypothetical protein
MGDGEHTIAFRHRGLEVFGPPLRGLFTDKSCG